MTVGTLSFLVTTPEVWVPDLGSGEHGFPLLTGAGRLVIKDTAILAGAIVVLADSAKEYCDFSFMTICSGRVCVSPQNCRILCPEI